MFTDFFARMSELCEALSRALQLDERRANATKLDHNSVYPEMLRVAQNTLSRFLFHSR